jgi:exodeoxyribonuclease-3
LVEIVEVGHRTSAGTQSRSGRLCRSRLAESGYSAAWAGQRTWNGVPILPRGAEIFATRRRLPGDPKCDQSRYIEAVVDGIVVACLYSPNGNPRPGPKFDYKLSLAETSKSSRDHAPQD